MTPKHKCPCCGYNTLIEKSNGSYEICEVCFWESDPIQNRDLNYTGGANKVSLLQAQINFLQFKACEERFIPDVRKPKKGE